MSKENFCPICGYDIYSEYREKPKNWDPKKQLENLLN